MLIFSIDIVALENVISVSLLKVKKSFYKIYTLTGTREELIFCLNEINYVTRNL